MRIASLLIFCLLQVPALQVAAQTAEQRRAEIQQKLNRLDEAAIPELLKQAASDPEPEVRRLILQRLSRLSKPEVREALERHAASDPDPGVALLALERLRIQYAQQLRGLLEQRLAAARAKGDGKALDVLVAEHQKWVSLAGGALLPGFLQTPPPVFEVAPGKSSIHFYAIGDFGQQNEYQRQVAEAAMAYHRRQRFDFGVTLGDNFVPDGVLNPADPRWQEGWEQIYGPLGVPVFASTGNHDWGYADSPAAQILYGYQSKSWRMPALYYSFTAGPAQFFALATHVWSETQARWLEQELGRSKARWKIVYGHHPIYSYGAHGDTPALVRTLLPVLRKRAQIYLAGHEHLVQHLQPEDGLHLLVAPAAGQSARPVKAGPRTLFSDSFYGFVAVAVDAQRIQVSFVDTAGKVRYQTEIR